MLTLRRMQWANCPEPDGGGIAVAGDAEIDEVAVGEVGAGQHRRHAAVHAVEAVRAAEVVRRLRGQPMPEFGDPVRGSSSKQAWMMAALIESWPPAGAGVETAPS
jgi:hypothetical protein